MDQKYLKYIRDNQKWPAEWSDRLTQMIFSLIPLGISFIGLSMLLGIVRFGFDHYSFQYILIAIIEILLGILSALLITRQIHNEQRFRALPLSGNSFVDLPNMINKIGWKNVEIKQSEVIECTSKISVFSWGESITLVKVNDNLILFNCRPLGIQPFTLRKDIRNYNKLNKILKSYTA